MRASAGWSAAIALVLMLGSAVCSATRNREALEKFSLAQLRLAYIMMPGKGDCGPPVASFQDPDGYFYSARPGSYLGELDGRITRITADKVVLVQIRPKGDGYIEVEVTVSLKGSEVRR